MRGNVRSNKRISLLERDQETRDQKRLGREKEQERLQQVALELENNERRRYQEVLDRDREEREYQEMLEREREQDRFDLDALHRDREDRRREDDRAWREWEQERLHQENIEREHRAHLQANTQHGRRPDIVFRHVLGIENHSRAHTPHGRRTNRSSERQEGHKSLDDRDKGGLNPLPSRTHHGSPFLIHSPPRVSTQLLTEPIRETLPSEQPTPIHSRLEEPPAGSQYTSPEPPLHGILTHPEHHPADPSVPPVSPHRNPGAPQAQAEHHHVHFAPAAAEPRGTTSPISSEHADGYWEEPVAPEGRKNVGTTRSSPVSSGYRRASVEEARDAYDVPAPPDSGVHYRTWL